jgi:GGDEF domain-containing protein
MDQESQMVMMDSDHFKKYQDTHGHLKGDELSVALSKLFMQKARTG